MSTIAERIASNSDAEELVLEEKGMKDLAAYLPLLTKMPNLKVLRLAQNQLEKLPEDLSALTNVETLDLTGNPIRNADDVVPGLVTMPNLRHLKITFEDQKEEDTLIISLMGLQSFNGTFLNGEGDQGPLPSPPVVSPPSADERYPNRSSVWLSSEALHHTVSASLPCKVVSSESFPDFKNRVVRYLNMLTAAERDPDVQVGELLKAQRVMADYCFEELLAAVDSKNTVAEKHGSENSPGTSPSDLGKGLRAIQQHYAALLDDYDRHWRSMAQRRAEQALSLRSELTAALGEVELLVSSSRGEAQERRPSGSTNRRQASRSPASPNIRGHLREAKAEGRRGETALSEEAPRSANRKVLTLRQLLDMIENIYTSKEKYDQRCAEHGLPSETMEQHMYTYLNQRYGLREIIVEYATAIVEGIKSHASEQNEVAVFAKILRNDVDEGFRFVQQQIRSTIPDLLRFHLKGKMPGRGDLEIQSLVQQKMASDLTETEWKFITDYMNAPEDATFLKELILQDIKRHYKDFDVVQRPTSLHYHCKDFLRLLLDFQLDGHERFLAPYVSVFRQYDTDGDGVVNRDELCRVVKDIVETQNSSAVQRVLDRLPPSCELITFSESVNLLSDEISHRVAGDANKNKTAQ